MINDRIMKLYKMLIYKKNRKQCSKNMDKNCLYLLTIWIIKILAMRFLLLLLTCNIVRSKFFKNVYMYIVILYKCYIKKNIISVYCIKQINIFEDVKLTFRNNSTDSKRCLYRTIELP